MDNISEDESGKEPDNTKLLTERSQALSQRRKNQTWAEFGKKGRKLYGKPNPTVY